MFFFIKDTKLILSLAKKSNNAGKLVEKGFIDVTPMKRTW